MRKFILLFIALMIPVFFFGESYSSLWKKVAEAREKDLPKTEYDLLRKIVRKAEKEKAYGHLLKAELQSAQAMSEVAPDSLRPAMERMLAKTGTLEDEVLKTVYQTVLYKVKLRNYSLDLQVTCPKLTEELCAKLAAVKDETYQPLVIVGADHQLFNKDLLNVIGYELSEFQPLYDYYAKTGNRRAACIVASQLHRYASVADLDSLIALYEDLPECGELAIVRYRRMDSDRQVTVGQKVAYIHEALGRWDWQRLNELRNKEAELTESRFEMECEMQLVRPRQPQTVKLDKLRHVDSLTLNVYRVNATANEAPSPYSEEGYKQLKPMLGDLVLRQVREYPGKAPYEFFDDTLTIEGLPVGVYMLEFSTNPTTEVVRKLYYVSDVYTIAEAQPSSDGLRYVVVSATTGQPIPGAHLHIREQISYNKYEDYDGVADSKGEFFLKTTNQDLHREVFAYTDTDQACPPLGESSRYTYYGDHHTFERVCIYTDRAIYRPGQTVHASALLYEVKNGIEHQVESSKVVTFKLRDANYKVVAEKEVTTDAYGVCAVDFTLPSSGLTGMYTVQTNNQHQQIRVEEYKRPTFHVDFPEVREAYQAGDTLTVNASALSYAGVPVQGARVSYKVKRRTAFWWWSYSSYWNTGVLGYSNEGKELASGETVTGDDGRFEVSVPLVMPETSYPMFYSFVVTADVTDAAGETRSGQLSLPLGNRKQALSVDLAEKILLEEKPQVTFHLYNAAGHDISTEVSYRVDDGAWRKAKTNSPQQLAVSQLSSGRHSLEAVCQGDTVNRQFVLFSLDDQTPATETDDWFYVSANQFPNDGRPVTLQAGSSDNDVHIVYSIFSGEKVIERGAVDKSNALLNLKMTYEETYGTGLLLTCAWVKNGHCYTHTATIKRPLPDKHLQLQWSTFRNRLTPGQQEEWTLTVKDCDGKPVDAQLMATLYDKSLDQLEKLHWQLSPELWLSLPSTSWGHTSRGGLSGSGHWHVSPLDVKSLDFSTLDSDACPSVSYSRFHRFSRNGVVYEEAMVGSMMPDAAPVRMKAMAPVAAEATNDAAPETETVEEDAQTEEIEMRENLNETAFFYPQLTTNEQGVVTMKFTMPESLTTWRFLGLAHTKDLCYGSIEGETVVQKDVMIQPNVPRFLREGDNGTIAARIFNTSDRTLTGKATLRLLDPETNAVVWQQSQPVTLKAGGTAAVTFSVSSSLFKIHASLLVCQMTVSGKGFSDGEQHYLPVLPSTERVTVTHPITQHHAGTETIDLAAMIPAGSKDGKLTLEYTNNPAWLMIQALPTVGQPADDNAISQAASLYANTIGQYILDKNPKAKTVFELWKTEQSTLVSQLEQNQELKDLVISETPWVLDADRETEQKQRLADFFDENLMRGRLESAVTKLGTLQQGSGAWSWWKGMSGSFYMTVAVSEMLVRLNAMAGKQQSTEQMLSRAFGFMGSEMVTEVQEMKKREKEGHSVSFPSFKALQWLYLATLDGRELPADVQKANAYLLNLVKKDIKSQSIYEKALTAVILSRSDAKRALEYAQSLKEYTVFREETGRYYDTPRAGYSWYDYKIPTQTVAIEALQQLTPDDHQTIEEMQRWLLQEKRTQAWDTPINSVNAVYAFLKGASLQLGQQQAEMTVDQKPLESSKATAAIGYVKTTVPAGSKVLKVEKTTEGTSWGAVYAQFTQQTKDIADSGSGITVKRELLKASQTSNLKSQTSNLTVGDRVKIRITIEADRDYDFVQVIDKRAACMEPVSQLSGYHQGSYRAPKDCSTNYYFDCLSKGKHVIESEYNIDRAGTYETGTCTVECAYAPEFRAVTKSLTLEVKK